MKRYISCFLFVVALQGAVCAQTARIEVYANDVLGTISPLIFGHNLEAGDTKGVFSEDTRLGEIQNAAGFWDPVKRAPNKRVMAGIKDLGITLMRYPGGSLANNFDWRKVVGPVEERGDWLFGLNDFVTLCRQMGAEPMITLSDYTLPLEQMPKHLAEMVEYLNAPALPQYPWAMKRKESGHEEPFGITFFELGNESHFGNHNVSPFRRFSSEQYAQYAIESAAAIRAVDPTVKLGLVLGGLGPAQDVDSSWNETVLALAGHVADFIVIHLYAPLLPSANGLFNDDEQMMSACMAVAEQWEFRLTQYRSLIRNKTGKDLPIAITEYNALLTAAGPGYRFYFGPALQTADLLRVMMQPQYGVFAANYWQVVNGYFGMLRTDKPSSVPGGLAIKPAYPLFRLWAQHFGEVLVRTTVTAPTQSFDGWPGLSPARGERLLEPRVMSQVQTDSSVPLSVQNPSGAVSITRNRKGDGFVIELRDYTGDSYPNLLRFKNPHRVGAGECDYRVTFQARLLASDPEKTIPLYLQMADDRGWGKSFSVMEVGPVGASEWKDFKADLYTVPGFTGGAVDVRLIARGNKVTQRLEVRNLKVEALSKLTFPEYSLLTASASLSEDRKTLYLMVFNKSAEQSIETSVVLRGFPAAEVRSWSVSAPSFTAIDGIIEEESPPRPLSHGAQQFSFPPRSMSALEFSLDSSSLR